MRFNATVEYPGSASQVAELFKDTEFLAFRFAGSHSSDGAHHVSGTAQGGFRVEVTRNLPQAVLPSNVQGFLPTGLTLNVVESWDGPTKDGSRLGSFSIAVVGMPATARGTARLQATSEQACSLIYEGQVDVSIPLFGSRVEQAVAQAFTDIVHRERDLAAPRLVHQG
ncbi:MAG TPA: DUF2505 domain-containing protein [Beutenbergiaceae bacterium]|nr:DUF2505 domain-containing protein [Beutenbergiaceae bacterium]